MDARQRQILDYLFNNSKSSHADISASVGIAVRQVHRHLAVLRAQNLIYRGGWDKDTSGAYRVVLWSVGNEPDAPRPYSKPRTAIPAQLSARAAKRADVVYAYLVDNPECTLRQITEALKIGEVRHTLATLVAYNEASVTVLEGVRHWSALPRVRPVSDVKPQCAVEVPADSPYRTQPAPGFSLWSNT